MYVDNTLPPFIDISLPPAIILPAYQLISLYVVVLLFDFALLKYEQKLYSVISKKQIRIVMTMYHILIPLVFISSHPPSNILFAAAPWFLASYSAHMPVEQLTFNNWYHSILAITVEDTNDQYTPIKIRIKGASKIALGVFKIVFCQLGIDPFLPRHPEYALEYHWLHPYSSFYTILFGIKAYCLLGVADIFMGLEQLLFGWNMVNLFNYPIISTSPRDFWSRRWNKVVHNLLHKQVFTRNQQQTITQEIANVQEAKVERKNVVRKRSSRKKPATNNIEMAANKRVTRSSARAAAATISTSNKHSTNTSENEDYIPKLVNDGHIKDSKSINNDVTPSNIKQPSFWSTRRGGGLMAFIVSGIFHELIVMSACRKITFENLLFFTLEGVFVMIEVELRQGVLKQEPTGNMRLVCIALHLFLKSIVGRLFTGPFLRYKFFS